MSYRLGASKLHEFALTLYHNKIRAPISEEPFAVDLNFTLLVAVLQVQLHVLA